jgi:uncharacterized short protein YbdD (DUF466 family)
MTDFVVSFLARGASLVRAIIGAPDYARYLQHMRAAHPGDRVQPGANQRPLQRSWLAVLLISR